MGGMQSGGSPASGMETGFAGGGMCALTGAADASRSSGLGIHSGSPHSGCGDGRRAITMGPNTTVSAGGTTRIASVADGFGPACMAIGDAGGPPPGSLGKVGNGSTRGCGGGNCNSLPLGIAARHAMAKAAGKTLTTMDAGFSGSKQTTARSSGSMGSGGGGITFHAGPLGHENELCRAHAATAGVDNEDLVLKIAKQRMQDHLQKQRLSETTRAAETLRASSSSNANSAMTGESSRLLPLWPGHKESEG